LNRCGVIYWGHFDVWLINKLQVSLDATWHLIQDSQTLTGWINGDLYTPADETIGILPVPDSIRASVDIESYQHSHDGKNKHAYLARQQRTKYAVISVHTNAEWGLFKKLMHEDPAFNWTNAAPDWKQCVKVWNRNADGQHIFYKVGQSEINIFIYLSSVYYIACRTSSSLLQQMAS
jgi:hypothetical protein